MEGAKGVCMNGMCSSSSNSGHSWKNGWPLQSGGFAILCDKCGSAYEELVFCETFHLEDSGWRECTSCGKRVHCGCIASSLLLQLLDTGGVNCIGCSTNTSKLHHIQVKPKGFELAQCNEDDFVNTEEVASRSIHQSYIGPVKNYGILQESTSTKSLLNGPLVQTNLSIGLSTATNSSNPLSRVIGEEHGCRPHTLLPKLPNSVGGIEANSSRTISPIRVARPPPVEGRIKNQLLPRYWPRITEQELQKISGDSNSIIVPLFEKILSASDAGRIGRLVLPKACAEAYFPPISQPEGISLRIQDVKGKEWVFQFRFWPNNNSRMYVLEGVTPCIQSMQLQAGDTVTFSRMDPEGKLLMGFRKATTNISGQQQASMNSGSFPAENLHSTSGIFQLLKGNSRNSSMPNLLSKHACTGIYTTPRNGSKNGDDQPFPTDHRKRSRNIGPKSKRLLMNGQDAIELKLSWDEVQDLLRPSPSVKPTTTEVEDQEFEEFEEPPVFGKSSIFIVRLSGEHEQWAQCDNCFKWRKLPADFLLPHKWTCQDNNQDQLRSSCSAPNELSSMELENLLRMNNELKNCRVGDSHKTTDNYEFQEASPIATTTKHPRHRPGCTCIVCIQPPSGKGKHDPTCTCNVCQTVKRRFKTLMMRKKKRQSEREAAQTTNQADVHDIPNQVDNTRSESCSRKLDLNVCPGRDSTMQSRVSMTSLVHEASLPLETYLRQNGLMSLISDQSPTSPSFVAPEESRANTEDEELENDPS